MRGHTEMSSPLSGGEKSDVNQNQDVRQRHDEGSHWTVFWALGRRVIHDQAEATISCNC